MGEANRRPVALVVLELEGRAHTRRADTVDRERRRGLRIAECEVVGLDGDDVREVGGQLEVDGERQLRHALVAEGQVLGHAGADETLATDRERVCGDPGRGRVAQVVRCAEVVHGAGRQQQRALAVEEQPAAREHPGVVGEHALGAAAHVADVVTDDERRAVEDRQHAHHPPSPRQSMVRVCPDLRQAMHIRAVPPVKRGEAGEPRRSTPCGGEVNHGRVSAHPGGVVHYAATSMERDGAADAESRDMSFPRGSLRRRGVGGGSSLSLCARATPRIHTRKMVRPPGLRIPCSYTKTSIRPAPLLRPPYPS